MGANSYKEFISLREERWYSEAEFRTQLDGLMQSGQCVGQPAGAPRRMFHMACVDATRNHDYAKKLHTKKQVKLPNAEGGEVQGAHLCGDRAQVR